MSRVTVAVLQTATLPSCLEIIPTADGPVRWEGRLSPNLIAPVPDPRTDYQNIRDAAKWAAELRMLAPAPYGSGCNEALGRFFRKLDDTYDGWLFAHIEAQISALLSFCESSGQIRRPDLIVLPEYSVTAPVAAFLAQLAIAAHVSLVAGTHAWWIRDWSNYPLKEYVDPKLTEAVIVRGNSEEYLSLCPIFMLRKNGLNGIIIPKLLASTYEQHLLAPPGCNRVPTSLEAAASVKLALFICSEFIRGPISDHGAERQFWDSIVNDQADAGLVAVPAYTPRTEIFTQDLRSYFLRQNRAHKVFAFANAAAFGHSTIAPSDVVLDRFAEAAIVRTVDVREGDNESLLSSLGQEHVIYFAPESDWLAKATESLQRAPPPELEDRSAFPCPAHQILARELARKKRLGASFARERVHWIPIPQHKVLALNIRDWLADLREAIQDDRALANVPLVITRQVQQIADYWGASDTIVGENRVGVRWLWPRRRAQPSGPQKRPWPLSIGLACGMDRRKQVAICCGLPADAIKVELQTAEQYLQECAGAKYGRRYWTVGHPSTLTSGDVIWEIDRQELGYLSRDEFSGIVEHHLDKAGTGDDSAGAALIIALRPNVPDEAFKLAQILDDSGCCVRADARVTTAIADEISATDSDEGRLVRDGVIAKKELDLFHSILQFRSNRLSTHELRGMEDGSSSRRKAFLVWLRGETGHDSEFMAAANVADIRVAMVAGLFGVPGRTQQPNEVRRCIQLVEATGRNQDLRLALRSLPISRELVAALLSGDLLNRAVLRLLTAREAAMKPPIGFDSPVNHWIGG